MAATVGRSRALGSSFVVFSGTLGVTWIALVGTPDAGVKPFHLSGFVFAVVAASRVGAVDRAVHVIRRWWAFWVGLALWLCSLAWASVVWADPYAPQGKILQQGASATVALLVATAFTRVDNEALRRRLWWCAPAAVTTTLLFLFVPLVRAGVNPLGVIGDALRTGNSGVILFGLFSQAFAGAGSEVIRTGLRHECISGIIATGAITLLVWDRDRPGRRWATLFGGAALAAALALVVFSLTRTMSATVAAWLLLVAARPLVRGRGRPTELLVAVAIVVGTLVLLFGPASALFAGRYVSGENRSLEVRSEASGEVIEDPFASLPFGSPAERDGDRVESPHNVVLDGLLAGGMLGLVGTSLMFGAVMIRLAGEVSSYLRGADDWHLPVTRAPVLLLGLQPVARFLSNGGGLLSLADWVALGAFFGLVTANDRLGRPRDQAGVSMPGSWAQVRSGTSASSGKNRP